MSGKRDPETNHLPIMGAGPEEFHSPRSCFDFPNPLAGKKEAHEKYPPIVTIDGRVDTDIDHLIDEEDDYTGPVVDMPSKFPKPHVFSVVEGSLDDDIDNYLNDDGTIEHTLADAPKNFNPSELKDVASNDSAHKSLDLVKRCPTDMPLTNRSYNKTHTEHSENEVTNEIAEGELSINVGSHELCTDDQPSEELVEAGPRQDLVNAASYEKMDSLGTQMVGSSETKEAVPEAQPETPTGLQENDSKHTQLQSPKANAISELFDKETLFRSPTDTFVVTDLERCNNVMYCQEDVSGRGDFILSTGPGAKTDLHTKSEDALQISNITPKMPEEVPAQQGRVTALLLPCDKSGTDLDAAINTQLQESADAKMIAKSDNPDAGNISILITCNNEQEIAKAGRVDGLQSPQVVPAPNRPALVREADNSDSDIDVTESLVLLSKLEEFKGDKQKAKEVLKEFKQLVLEGSQTKLDRLSKSESTQSSITDTPQRSLKSSEHMLNTPQKVVAKSETVLGSTTLFGGLKDTIHLEDNGTHDPAKEKSSERDCRNEVMVDQRPVVKGQSDPIVYDKVSKNPEAIQSISPGLSQLPKAQTFNENDGQLSSLVESTEQNNAEHTEDGQMKHYSSPSTEYIVDRYTHFQLAAAVDRELRSQSCDDKIHRKDDDALGVNDSSNSLCDRKTESLRASKIGSELNESQKVVSRPGDPYSVPVQKGSRERSLSSSRKASRHGINAPDCKDEFQTEHFQYQKNAHKCPSSVKLDKEIPPRHTRSPSYTFSPGALSVDSLHRGENERNTERIRDRAVSVDRKMKLLSADARDHRYEDTEVDPKHIRKESAQSIKESLKEAIKVAEESMSAAARVARALSIVIEASKPPFGNESSTDEEGLIEGYDRLMSTMTTLAACKEYKRPHSVSPSKRSAKPLDNIVDQSNVKPLPIAQTISSSHGKLNEYSLDSEKHATPRDYKKKEKPNEAEPKSSFVTNASRGREAMKPSPCQAHQKPEKKEAEDNAIIKSTCIEEKQRHESNKVRPHEDKGTDLDVKPAEEKCAHPEDKQQRTQDSKHRSGEDKHSKVKSADSKHRADSEGRRKHDNGKSRHEEKRHKSSRGKQERSADGRVKGLETKRSAEGLRELKKEKVLDATPRQHKEPQEAQKASSQENPGLSKDKETKGAVLQHTTYHAKSAHKADTKRNNNESETAPQKLPSNAHVSHRTQLSEEALQGPPQKATHRSQEVPAPPPPTHDKEEMGDSVMHPPPDEARKVETVPHEWRIPRTKHNANRKSESIFEQVTLINPIGDCRANKILVRRLLQGSRVDFAESEASETDSLEFDSNFNRVENYGSTVEAMPRRQDKARGHSSRPTIENTACISGDPAKFAYVREWHNENFRHQNKNYSTSQEATREELQTAYSYKASHTSDRTRPSVAEQSHHKNAQRPPKPDHQKAAMQLSGKVGHVQFLPDPRSCPNMNAEPKPCDSEISALTTSQQSEMSDSTTGPKISVLKHNIIMHQLPFPEKRKNAQPKCLPEGNFFSPIFEEVSEKQDFECLDSDAISSVESDLWWRPSTELNTNNGNVYDSLLDDLGSDVDGRTRKTPVAERREDKEGGSSSSLLEKVESGVDAVPMRDPVKEDARSVTLGEATSAATTEGDVELHKVDIVEAGGDVEVLPQSEGDTLRAVEHEDTKSPVPLESNAVSPAALKGNAVSPAALEGNAVGPAALEGNSESPAALEGNAKSPVKPELTTNETQPEALNDNGEESNPTRASSQGDKQSPVVVVRDELQGVTETPGFKHEIEEDFSESGDKGAIPNEAGEAVQEVVEGARQQVGEEGATGEEGTATSREIVEERQTSPNKPVPVGADSFPLRIKQETRNWSQRKCDLKMCSRLVDISNGHGVVDPWLRKSQSVGLGAWNRLREQESITKDNFEIVKRLIAQETVYSREEQLKDYEKCTRWARRMPEDDQKASVPSCQQQSTRANLLAKEQAQAIDEFCSKGISNNKLKRSLSLPPIRKQSLCMEKVKSPYSRQVLLKDFLVHCTCLKNISKHPSVQSRMSAKDHTLFASRLEDTDRRVKLATQKIDQMCKNKEPPYAPRRQKSKM